MKQSPNIFFGNLIDAFWNANFVQEVNLEPYLFISDNLVSLIYMDGYLHSLVTNIILLRLFKEKLDIDINTEDSDAGFLGINIQCEKAAKKIEL